MRNIVLEQDRCNMANQDLFVSLLLEGLDRIDHADVLAHLEGGFCDVKLNIPQTVFADHFEEGLPKLV